jgi:DNA-binding YbaB/EbfC family protein
MFDKMKALLDMQKKMQELKRQLESATFEIASIDGLLKITMSGTQEVKEVNIQGSLMEIEKSILEKNIKDVYNRAVKQSQEVASQKMKDITGLNLPGVI